MPDTPFPQLTLFVANRELLPLYREFIFPLVPRRTGLLPVGLDDIRADNAENTSIAIDIALRKAAVVIFDTARSRLRLDYVRMRRNQLPLIEVTAPRVSSASVRLDEPTEGEGYVDLPMSKKDALPRPAEMSAWPQAFVNPLIDSIRAFSPAPDPSTVYTELSRMENKEAYENLLLTALALLERRMRMDETATTVPIDPSDGMMEQFQKYFETDFPNVIEAVSLRHKLLRHGKLPEKDRGDLKRVALLIATMARTKYIDPSP